MFSKKTVRDIDLTNKRILMRADYSVPVKDGRVQSDFRIKQSLPTIRYILDQPGTSLVIISHLGRPTSGDKKLSLEPVAEYLGELLGQPVGFVDDCVGDKVKIATSELKPGEVLLLENLRFYEEEKQNNPDFARAIADSTQAKIFVQDGFGVVHRKHASTNAITKMLPSVAGLLVEKEVQAIEKVMQEPKRPLMAVLGGAKVSDKIDLLNHLIDLTDCVAVAGGIANTFLLANGSKLGKSLAEPGAIDIAHDILTKVRRAEKARSFQFLLPVDVVVSTAINGLAPTKVIDLTNYSLADIQSYPKIPRPPLYSIGAKEMILDIGPVSAGVVSGAIKMAKTVIWNGTCGVTETKGIAGAHDPFSHGTRTIVEAMISTSRHHANKPFTLVGGGDTVGYIESQGQLDDFDYISTGGGAYLDLLAGKKLPGVEALLDKHE